MCDTKNYKQNKFCSNENIALLTAHGTYSAKVIDGRILTGEFAWTFVYSKIKGNWKVIHSHMSNPKA